MNVQARLKEINNEKDQLLAQLDEQRARKRFECAWCKKTHAIRDCEVIQTYWYTPPSGCMDGDYWNSGELQIICPTTDHKLRVLFRSHYEVNWEKREEYAYSAEQQFKRMYKKLFKAIIDDEKTTDERYTDRRQWVNTNYFDEHRARFGLHVKGLDKEE